MTVRLRNMLLLAAAAGMTAVAFTGRTAGTPGRESAALTQAQTERGPSHTGPLPPAARYAEPLWGASREGEEVSRALAGEPGPEGSSSEAVARAIQRLRAAAPPAGEVFALIKVTDRKTGERQVFVRGTPSADLTDYLEDPQSAPAGTAYDEGDEVIADEEVEVSIRSVNVRSVPVGSSGPSLDQQDEHKLRARNADGTLSHRIEQGLRRRVADKEIDLATSQMIPVAIEIKNAPKLRLPRVHDVTAGGLLWVGLEVAAAREEAIIQRKKMMPQLQAGLVQAVEEAGGSVRYASWTSGALDAQVPASAIAKLAEHPELFSIEYVEPLVETSHRYRGDDYFVATDSEDFDQFHNGVNGLSSKHSYTSRVVLAMGEQCIDLNNPAWRTGAPGTFNRGWYYDCDPGGVCTQGGVEGCSGTNSHGTRVAQMMTGDFMDGQDAAVSAANRRIMTGTCPECRFFFLQDQNLNQRTKVLDAACDLGVDIFQSSISSIAQSCDGNGDYDGTLQDMIDCDVHYVQSAGNEGSGGGCSTTYPGDHPWTLTVGGMQTEDPCNTSGAYYTSDCIYEPNASRGGATYDGDAVASVIDITGPYRLGNAINPLTSGPVTFGNTSGTSFASPLVAGLMAELMDWWNVHVSTSIFFDNRMRNFMMLMGDRSSGSSGVSRLLNDTSVFWGAGRVGLVPFDDKATWSIRRSSSTLSPGEEWNLTADVSSSATFYKAVVWHDGTDYSDQPMIRLSLNPSGCSNATQSVDRLDSKVILVYTNLDGCDSIDVTVENVLAGFHWARKFHFASYSDTESERNF